MTHDGAVAPRFDEVWLARHGETEWNVCGRRQGRLDSALTARGQRQARQLSTTMAAVARGGSCAGTVPIDSLWSSPLGRCRETAGIIGAALELPVRVLDDLAEIDHGDFAGLTTAEIDRRWPGVLSERAADKYRWRFPGGESYRDAAARASSALGAVATAGAQRPLIVTHAMVGRMVIALATGGDPSDCLNQTVDQGTAFRLGADGSIEARTAG